jgi:hypothetical protein
VLATAPVRRLSASTATPRPFLGTAGGGPCLCYCLGYATAHTGLPSEPGRWGQWQPTACLCDLFVRVAVLAVAACAPPPTPLFGPPTCHGAPLAFARVPSAFGLEVHVGAGGLAVAACRQLPPCTRAIIVVGRDAGVANRQLLWLVASQCGWPPCSLRNGQYAPCYMWDFCLVLRCSRVVCALVCGGGGAGLPAEATAAGG